MWREAEVVPGGAAEALDFDAEGRENGALAPMAGEHTSLEVARLGIEREARDGLGFPMRDEGAGDEGVAETVIKRHLDKHRTPSPSALQDARGGMSGAGDSVVVGMPALIGVGDDAIEGPGGEEFGKPFGDVRDLGSGLLVGNAEAVHAIGADPREGEGVFCLATPRGRVLRPAREASRMGIPLIPRRTVRDMEDARLLQARKEYAGADDFVIRVRGDHDGTGGKLALWPDGVRHGAIMRRSGLIPRSRLVRGASVRLPLALGMRAAVA